MKSNDSSQSTFKSALKEQLLAAIPLRRGYANATAPDDILEPTLNYLEYLNNKKNLWHSNPRSSPVSKMAQHPRHLKEDYPQCRGGNLQGQSLGPER